MRASRDIRSLVSWLRKKAGRKNGAIPAGMMDIPEMERQAAKNAKQRSRKHFKIEVDHD
ncbi:hypothetical protein ACUSIJ_24655 [Pseudochelatococcus sp. B33]